MHVGTLFIFQNYEDRLSDTEAFARDIRMAVLSEELGFDSVWSVEHHFDNYSMATTPAQILSYIAGRTKHIKLGTAAVILPWNDPLRVAEQMILLDHLSEGRALFGIGRGLAKLEYDAFQIEMSEARGRFNEAAAMVLNALETGYIESDGPYYKRPRTRLRPGPYRSFKERYFMTTMSSDSVPVCAETGATMMVFAQKPWKEMVGHIKTYQNQYEQEFHRPPPPPVLVDFLACSDSADRAEELAREHMSNYYSSIIEHYALDGNQFDTAKGYGDYAKSAKSIREGGRDKASQGFVEINTWGTPQQILEQLEERRRIVGDFDLVFQATYGGMSEKEALHSMTLFAQKVVPELRSWSRSQAA